MYNLTVDVINTYYVFAGQTPALVHNTNGPCTPFGPKLNYEPNPQHGGGKVGGKVSPEPTNPQQMLDQSKLFNSGSGRRVAYDESTGEIVVFARTNGATFHGYVSTWRDLPQGAKNVLIQSGIFKSNGKLK
jgi:hypothetical protein